jgi:hypothetical protein|tara:strand:- start:161 stop:841 length:681 start_codon:yes stop_codon:yes gene_type:complete
VGFITTYKGKQNYFEGNVGLGVIPDQRLSVAGNISASGSISAVNYSGSWQGNVLSSAQVNVEGIDIKSTGQTKDLFLKSTGDGRVVWDLINEGDEFTFSNEIDGDLIVRGDIIEYSAGGIVYSKTSVFTGPMSTGANTLETFNTSQFKTAKYIITLSTSLSSRTACEVLVTHNGASVADGTTYGIVDAQATSLLSDITASIATGTINLDITTTADCTAIVYGVAHY